MTKLTETQTMILSAGVQRLDNIASPLPKWLAGAAAKMAVGKLIEHGWLHEVDANLRRGEPLWQEIGDGHGTTLAITEAGLLAIGIDPAKAKKMLDARNHPTAERVVKLQTPRAGTKQALLIDLLKAPQGATMPEIMTATQWLAQTARGAMSGALGKKLGLVVTSAKEEGRGRVYRVGQHG